MERIVKIRKIVIEKVHEYIVGNNELIELILVALFSQGHILIEGGPGTAKTSIAKIISQIIGCEFKRIQGAVDIQPADMIGVQVYDPKTHSFHLRKGPIFTNFLLIDELNRINPKSQSAFIEGLSEKQVTIDGDIYPLPSPFIVFATQNPYEMQGTFPLIEVQKDRFAYSNISSYLDAEGELLVIQRASTGELSWEEYSQKINPVITQEELLNLIRGVKNIRMEDPILRYIRDIIIATRRHNDITLGASSRASVAIVNGAKSLAALHGREYVIPDDVKWLTPFALLHRIYLTRAAEVDGIKVEDIISEILETIEVP
ncbi:MAG: MoxR family ATPase [Methanomicrobiales archaeon]|nr:MoxR family ATPase [Methanomicrobiales archaeon]